MGTRVLGLGTGQQSWHTSAVGTHAMGCKVLLQLGVGNVDKLIELVAKALSILTSLGFTSIWIAMACAIALALGL